VRDKAICEVIRSYGLNRANDISQLAKSLLPLISSHSDRGVASSRAIHRRFLLLSFHTTQAALSALESSINSLQDELKDKVERLATAEEEIRKLSEKVTELNSKAEEASLHSSQLERERTETRDAAAEILRLKEKVDDLEAKLTEATKERGNLEQEKEAQKAAWEEEKQSFQARVTVLEDEMKENSLSLKNLEAEYAQNLIAEKEKTDSMTSQTEKEAAEAAKRIQSLEAELIKAHSEAATARQSLEEQLKTKQKEVTDTKAKLRRTVRTKYSFRTLSSDFVAWFNKKWKRL